MENLLLIYGKYLAKKNGVVVFRFYDLVTIINTIKPQDRFYLNISKQSL